MERVGHPGVAFPVAKPGLAKKAPAFKAALLEAQSAQARQLQAARSHTAFPNQEVRSPGASAAPGSLPGSTPPRAAAVARAPAEAGAASQAAAPRPGSGADQAFRQRIAAAESSATATHPGYGARNAASGALGRYQLLPLALRDLGWQDQAGGWTPLAHRQGVATDADFLANPAAQEAAMDGYLRRAATLLAANGALGHAGIVVPGIAGSQVPVSEAGLLAAAHRRGAGSVARYLSHRTDTPAAPLSANDQRAFAQVEKRLRDFADLPLPQVARLPGRGRTAA